MFGRWRRKTSIEQVQGIGRVKLQASVISLNLIESPFTGLRAAALEWLFFVRYVS